MEDNLLKEKECQTLLESIPQKPPFRFIDKILEISETHIVAEYRFKQDEFFYKGHFPGNPITPGVILVESMAQAGVVALGIYLMQLENKNEKFTTLLTDCEVDFLKMVSPGNLVYIRGEKIFWRRNKLKTNIILKLENGEIAANGVISGMGVVQ